MKYEKEDKIEEKQEKVKHEQDGKETEELIDGIPTTKEDLLKTFENFKEFQEKEQVEMSQQWDADSLKTINEIRETVKPIYPQIADDIEKKLKSYMNYEYMFSGNKDSDQRRVMPQLDKFLFNQAMKFGKDNLNPEQKLEHYEEKTRHIFEEYGMTMLWSKLEETQETAQNCIDGALRKEQASVLYEFDKCLQEFDRERDDLWL